MGRAAPCLLVLVLTVGCGGASTETVPPPTVMTQPAPGAGSGPDAAQIEAWVGNGMTLMQQGRCDRAIAEGFEPALQAYGRQYANANVVAVRGGVPGAPSTPGAVVIDSGYPDTIYMEAYCLVEMGRPDDADPLLRRALQIIPNDVVYACELGNIEQQRRKWNESMALYQGALDNVSRLMQSAPQGAAMFGLDLGGWRRRAMRGIGFTLIELGRLDEAEALYRQILQLEPNDERALNELDYIRQLRAGGGQIPPPNEPPPTTGI